jgi:hypothetical protein
MTDPVQIDNAFGLRWLQDDDRGRLVYEPGKGDFRSAADAISVLGLGCDETALRESLDRFPPHLRIHGGYTPFVGDAATRFTLTWEPGAELAAFVQLRDGSGEGPMTGNVDVPTGGALKDVLRDLLVPDARDVVEQALEDGKSVSMKNVDFWIGDAHFRVSDQDAS